MITAHDYPKGFYARLAECWPSLAFVCSVNGEMGDFGGIVMVLRGQTHDLVLDYDADYSRRAHKHAIRRLLREWSTFLTAGRPFLAVPGPAWKFGAMPFDAHFDEDYLFWFCTSGETARFKARYKEQQK